VILSATPDPSRGLSYTLEQTYMARGRKSGIELAMAPALPGERPRPPLDLDVTEARLWKAIVGALPAAWLDDAGQEVLTRAVAQGALCELLEAQLRDLRNRDHRDNNRMAELAVQHAAAGKAFAALLGVLRATPATRMVSRDAGRRLAQVPRVRPWEALKSDGEAS
jgi:hypothetical protein